MKGENALLSFIVGVGIGAALGVLFAPNKGTETRRKLKKEFDHRKDQLEDLVDNFQEIIEEGKESLKEVIAETKNLSKKNNPSIEFEE